MFRGCFSACYAQVSDVCTLPSPDQTILSPSTSVTDLSTQDLFWLWFVVSNEIFGSPFFWNSSSLLWRSDKMLEILFSQNILHPSESPVKCQDEEVQCTWTGSVLDADLGTCGQHWTIASSHLENYRCKQSINQSFSSNYTAAPFAQQLLVSAVNCSNMYLVPPCWSFLLSPISRRRVLGTGFRSCK